LSTTRRKILIITPNALHNGPRLLREIDALKAAYDITAVGATPPHDPAVAYIPFSSIQYSFTDKVIKKGYRLVFKTPLLANLPGKERRIHNLLRSVNPDIVIAHYPIELPYLFSFPDRKFKVVYNAHEYHPLEFDSNVQWLNTWGRLYTHIYKKYLHQVDLLINVCDSIAEKCEQEFGKKSLVVPNAANYRPDIKPVETTYNQPLRIIHHGGSVVDRKIEIMIDAVAQLGESYTLDLMLVPSNPAYHQQLLRKAAQTCNVKIIAPVGFSTIVPVINQYDIGLYNLPAHNYNERVALPNKLFEFIQARLCIVVSPSVEMKKIVQTFDLGKVSSGFDAASLAAAIRELSPGAINTYKLNAGKAAPALSAEHFMKQFTSEMEKL
jgi:glycosyltransferase involved in cell wall biosynthesis